MSFKEKMYRKLAAFLLKKRFAADAPFAQYLRTKGDTYCELLFGYAVKKPYFHLDGYMNRWWVLRHPQRPGDKDYRTNVKSRLRNALRYLYPFYARFHLIMRPDAREPWHNHPFAFVSLIMAGWYEEEVVQPDGQVFTYRYNAGDVNIKDANSYHRITAVSPDGVMTLVIMGRRTGDSWGFLVDGEHVPFDEYLKLNRDSKQNGFLYLDQALKLMTACLAIAVVSLAVAVIYGFLSNTL